MERNKVTRHNTDIAACDYDKCPQKETCLRWQLGLNKDPYQVYLYGEECNEKYYLENKL